MLMQVEIEMAEADVEIEDREAKDFLKKKHVSMDEELSPFCRGRGGGGKKAMFCTAMKVFKFC